MKIAPRYSLARRDCYHIGNVAEKMIAGAFKNIHRMPVSNPGYDYLQTKTGKKIEVKSATQRNGGWIFQVKYNKTPDVFVFLAFDSIERLQPVRMWVVPGEKINHRATIHITNTDEGLDKWHSYERSIDDLTQNITITDEPIRTAPYKLTCAACAFTWLPRTAEPKKCPKCGSRNWQKKRSKP